MVTGTSKIGFYSSCLFSLRGTPLSLQIVQIDTGSIISSERRTNKNIVEQWSTSPVCSVAENFQQPPCQRSVHCSHCSSQRTFAKFSQSRRRPNVHGYSSQALSLAAAIFDFFKICDVVKYYGLYFHICFFTRVHDSLLIWQHVLPVNHR